jgi:1-deoxy-D-xylulose-5-phosphate reductoisomerase
MNSIQPPALSTPPKKLIILGSTGSIGTNVLDVVRRFPERFRILGLAAGRNIELLTQQVDFFKPRCVAVLHQKDAKLMKRSAGNTRVLFGEDGFIDLALTEEADMIVSAQVGAAGLKPTFAAISAGKAVGLANKETLVMAGELVMYEVSRRGVSLIPIDSEHSAIHQCLQGHNRSEVKRIILTASGGPFRNLPPESLSAVNLEQVLAHPTWEMGAKITVDSATLMNKGLEAIEARWLFGISMNTIDVHIHPQSVVHSMVEYIDGSIVAQLSIPDMRIPIAYALAFPERLPLDLPPLNFFDIKSLTFERPNWDGFPCLRMAFDAGRIGGTMPVVLNAANEVAVKLFLEHRISFVGIPALVEKTLERHTVGPLQSMDQVIEIDTWSRETAHGLLPL